MSFRIYPFHKQALFRFAALILIIIASVAFSQVNAQEDRAGRAMKKNDRNKDGKVGRDEWRKSQDIFDAIDADGDGFLTIGEFRARFAGGKTKSTNTSTSPQSSPASGPSSPSATGITAPPGLYFVDAHSQWDHRVDEERILSLMDHGGIYKTLLSVHLKRPWEDVVSFSKSAPDRIVPAVRIKGRGYHHKGTADDFLSRLDGQSNSPAFAAMAEVHVWHDSDGGKFQEIKIDFDDELFLASFARAKRKGWPFIIHIEFASLSSGDRDNYMKNLDRFLSANQSHPFVMIHMAQLEEPDVRRLLSAHTNLHFMTSHASKFYQRTGKPFINMIENGKFKPQWKRLVTEYPDRFIFAMDNVFSKFWMPDLYLKKMKMWWSVAADLPEQVAHAFAHGNAERLWKLSPKTDGGMMSPEIAMRKLGPVTGKSGGKANR